MNKKKICESVIISNESLGNAVYHMKVNAPEIASIADAGQFVHIKTGYDSAPLLRRPISIADIKNDELSLIYKVVGKGTKWLSECAVGDTLDIMGPLGRGFSAEAKKPLLAGGGIGIAPLIYLARKFSVSTRSTVLLAGRSQSDIMPWTGLFNEFDVNSHITTDDGSLGACGNIMCLLPELCEKECFDAIYACGPTPMLKALKDYALQKNIPCQLSLESHMACGLGTCLACSCNSTDGKRVKICLNGPVFEAGEIEL